MVHPRVADRTPVGHEHMPTDVRAVYDEARSIADLSPRSAATLLRVDLETLTKEHLGHPTLRLDRAI